MLFSAQQFIISIPMHFVKAQILRFWPCRADFLARGKRGRRWENFGYRGTKGEIPVQNLIFSLNATLPEYMTMVAG